jgi:hypothetical protein
LAVYLTGRPPPEPADAFNPHSPDDMLIFGVDGAIQI